MWRVFLSGVFVGCALALLFLPQVLHAPLAIAHEVEAVVAPQPVTILAFGDLMLDRAVRADMDAKGALYPFEKIAPTLAGHDIVVANSEGIFSDNESISMVDNNLLDFTFATSTLPILKQLGFTDLSQANNHALNFGWPGLRESRQWILHSGIATFGDPDNINPGPLYEHVRGTTVAFVGYDEFSSSSSDQSVLDAIAQAHKSGAFTVVYPHWGLEYNLGTTTLQETEAHKFIDAGADAVLGAHPHVVEPTEIYKNKPIFYSMGNFIFDQAQAGPTAQGIAVEISLTPSSATYTTIPFSIVHAQPTPLGTSTSFTVPR